MPQIHTFTGLGIRIVSQPQHSYALDASILENGLVMNKDCSENIFANDYGIPFFGTFVTVGTSFYDFSRLLESVYECIDHLPCPVIVQYGYSKKPDLIEGVNVIQFLSNDIYLKLIRESPLLICHAGAGSILDRLNAGHVSLIMTRDPSRGEHIDDHQAQITRKCVELQISREVKDSFDIKCAINEKYHLKIPPRLQLDRSGLFGPNEKVLIVGSTGGHLTEALRFKDAYPNADRFVCISNEKKHHSNNSEVLYFPHWKKNYVFLYMCVLMIIFLIKNRDIKTIFTTGSNIGFVALLCGFFFGKRLIAVDTITRIENASKWFGLSLFIPRVEAYVYDWAVWPIQSMHSRKIKIIKIVSGS